MHGFFTSRILFLGDSFAEAMPGFFIFRIIPKLLIIP